MCSLLWYAKSGLKSKKRAFRERFPGKKFSPFEPVNRSSPAGLSIHGQQTQADVEKLMAFAIIPEIRIADELDLFAKNSTRGDKLLEEERARTSPYFAFGRSQTGSITSVGPASMAEKSIIIIGAGLSGLSAGCYGQM